MTDYIKREDAINTVRNTFTGMTADTLELRINDIPSADVVEVVRCKDCVHGTDRTEDFQEEDERWDVVNPIDCMMYSSDGIPDFFPKDNYCGFGERKDNEID